MTGLATAGQAQATAATAALRSTPGLLGPESAEKDPEAAARGFAGLFYSMMISEMRETVPENPYFSNRGQEVFRSLWTSRMGEQLAARPDDALSASILEELEGRGISTRTGVRRGANR